MKRARFKRHKCSDVTANSVHLLKRHCFSMIFARSIGMTLRNDEIMTDQNASHWRIVSADWHSLAPLRDCKSHVPFCVRCVH